MTAGALAKGRVTLTCEPSGEIRLRVTRAALDDYGRTSTAYAASTQPEAASLVHSDFFGDARGLPSGYGGLPRDSAISSYGRRQVKNACGILASKYGRRVVFLTLTLPGSTGAAHEALARWSGKVSELLRKWVRHHAPSAEMVHVWEWQKRGALHLHAAIGSHDVLALRKLRGTFRDYAHRMFETISQHAQVDVFERADGGTWRGKPEMLRSRIEDVRKCVKRYMAKYLTKQQPEGVAHSPSQWWGMFDSLRCSVNAARTFQQWTGRDLRSDLARLSAVKELAGDVGWTAYIWQSRAAPCDITLALYPNERAVRDAVAVVSHLVSQDLSREQVVSYSAILSGQNG